MMDKSFGLILAVIALVAGIMLLTGHGDILLKGGNTKLRKEKYDEKKMTWGKRSVRRNNNCIKFRDKFLTTQTKSMEEIESSMLFSP